MDLGVTITAAIIIALCSLPFIISSRRRRKIEKQLLLSLSEIAKQHNGKISQHEISGNYAIGIDETKGLLFFKKKTGNNENTQFIDLAEIQSCQVINTGRTVKTGDDQYNVIDRLDLQFVPRAGNGANIKWVFYDAENHMQLNGELQSIEKWSKLIKEKLKS